MGRLVKTHSTYIEGLIICLKRLAEKDGIKTITPAVIKSGKGRSGSNLTIKITSKTLTGYKLLARKSSNIQEVFVVTLLDKDNLKKLIEESIKN